MLSKGATTKTKNATSTSRTSRYVNANVNVVCDVFESRVVNLTPMFVFQPLVQRRRQEKAWGIGGYVNQLERMMFYVDSKSGIKYTM